MLADFIPAANDVATAVTSRQTSNSVIEYMNAVAAE